MKAILVLNAGSSSLKFALYPIEPELQSKPALSGQVEGIGANPVLSAKDAQGQHYESAVPRAREQSKQHAVALEHMLDWLNGHNSDLQIIAAGHRVVHGGVRYSAPVLLTGPILRRLDRLIPLAPLHQPHNLHAIRAVQALLGDIPEVGCFDTAFHRTQPEIAQLYGLPREITESGVKRYGFHGLSYDYVSRKLPDVIGDARSKGAVVIAHLGNGASLCGLRDGKSVATTMGFSALDGLVMGTRCGDLDPGVLLYLIENRNMDVPALNKLLYKESGLLGMSGISQDMRVLLESSTPEAKEAVELFCYRIVREIGSMAAAAGGLEALVFTGGIGEHAWQVREAVCKQLGWMGVTIDDAANHNSASRIEGTDSKVAVAVVPTNEELMIARYTMQILERENALAA